MVLPATVFPWTGPTSCTFAFVALSAFPLRSLFEMTFRSAGSPEEPMRLLRASDSIVTPACTFPRSSVPVASTPM
jgi:hypothetical protein